MVEDGLDEVAAATAGDTVSVYIGLNEEEPGRHGSAPARALSVRSVASWRVGEDALVAAMGGGGRALCQALGVGS